MFTDGNERRRGKLNTAKEMASMGGSARADSLTPEKRSAIPKKAAAPRWGTTVKSTKKATTKDETRTPSN